MKSIWLSIRQFVPLFFMPAGAGLLWQATYSEALAQRLLALALALFCLELATMAKVDLDNIFQTLQQTSDARLHSFLFVVNSTIVLELIGFYTALFSPAVGALAIVCSQLWFNLLAKLQLQPKQTAAIISFGILQRIPILLANAVGIGLLSLWFVPNLGAKLGVVIQMRQWLAGGLLALVAIFLLIKYALLSIPSVTNGDNNG